jgi:hypothetical protein
LCESSEVKRRYWATRGSIESKQAARAKTSQGLLERCLTNAVVDNVDPLATGNGHYRLVEVGLVYIMISSAPAFRASSAFSAVETVAMTFAPTFLAI